MKGIEELLSHRTEIDAELRKHKSPVTVMFTDMAGSTKYFERFGDTAGMAWIEEHYRIVFPAVQERQGVVVKTIGDSVMAYFTDPAQAIDAAVAIQKAIEASNQGRLLNEQMHVRVALHHGLAYLRGVDVFGDVVNVAARIAKACLPGQILVSEALQVSAQQTVTLQFRPVGAVQFHGKSGVEKLFEIFWTDDATYQKLRELFPPRKDQQTSYEEFSGGRYIIMNELGRGAMGVVYKAYDRSIGRMVGLKTIPLEMDEHDRPELLGRLKQEARAAGSLDHPNIVTVYDVGEEAGMFYFTMQYVEGKTLASVRAEKSLLPLEQVLDISDQVCSAIGFAHQSGIIHRDIKPSNLMLTPQGTVKVMDFGIAKLGDAGLTKAGVIVGTPSYLAPEQAAGRRIDHRADIFALGSVLYELLTAEKAFPGESTTSIIFKILNEDPIPPRVIEPSLPPALDAIVQKALAKDPNQRFQSCEEMREALRECRRNPKLAAATITAGTVKTMRRTMFMAEEPPPRKTGWIVAAVIVLVLAAASGGGFYWWKKQAGRVSSAPPAPPPSATAPAATPPAMPATDAQTAIPATPNPEPPPPELKLENTAAETKIAESDPTKEEKAGKGRKGKGQTASELAKAEKAGKKKAAKAGSAQPTGSAAEDTANAQTGPKPSGAWSREDIPDLLAKADNYAGKGEYQRAIYLYDEILRLDPQNQPAKDGLRRAKEAQGIRR